MWWAESQLTPFFKKKRKRDFYPPADVHQGGQECPPCPLTFLADYCVSLQHLPTSLCDQVSNMTNEFTNLDSFPDVEVNVGKFKSLKLVDWLKKGVVKEVKDNEDCSFVDKQDQCLTRVLNEILISTYLFCNICKPLKKHLQEPIAICAPEFRVLYKKAGVFNMETYLNTFYSTAEKDFLTLLVQLCNLLSHLQTEYKFVHGDLKLDNLMVDRSDPNNIQVVMIDFGFSSLTHPSNESERLSTIQRSKEFHDSYDLLFLLMYTTCRNGDYMKNKFPDVFDCMKSFLNSKVNDQSITLWRKMYKIELSCIPNGLLTPEMCLQKICTERSAKSTVQPSSTTPTSSACAAFADDCLNSGTPP